MTDIVERLRKEQRYMPTYLAQEAADEIERLQGHLQRIEAINDSPARYVREIDDEVFAALGKRT